MKVKLRNRQCPLAGRQGFSMVEVLVGVALLGILFVTLYTAFSAGFGVIQLARENLRATQVLQEKMETIRLYSWDQINAAGFIPKEFQAPFYAVGEHADDEKGLTYYGTVEVSAAPLAESYSADMKLVKIKLKWTSGRLQREREVQTFVSRYGLQNYIY
jgi:prepilin-type N-terminal cleavage/methylation domain-containing protein